MQLGEVVAGEVAFEEHKVGDGHLFGVRQRQPELLGTLGEVCGSRVRVDRSDRQTVPGGHTPKLGARAPCPGVLNEMFTTGRP